MSVRRVFRLDDLKGRIGRRIGKSQRIALAAVATPLLAAASRASRRSLIDPRNETVVSLTSYGDRLGTVHLTLESIGRGRSLPGRLILWTDPGVELTSLPSSLRRMQRRGLEIEESGRNFGPHTKYFPYVMSEHRHTRPLVTADDDTLYPRRWLRSLEKGSAQSRAAIVCHRAHRVVLTSHESIAAYNTWPPVMTTRPSPLNFATGVSGVIYPPDFLNVLKDRGDLFEGLCPKADDVWLHFVACADGREIRQVGPKPRKFPEVFSTQNMALHRSNTAQSANDPQIAKTYTKAVTEMLWRESVSA